MRGMTQTAKPAVACPLDGRVLTPQSTGRPTAGFAHCRPPVTSNVRALRMPSLVSSKRSICIAGPAPVHRSRRLPVLSVTKASFSSSRQESALFSGSAKVGLLPRCAVQSCLCSTGTAARSVQFRHTKALRADVLRRAISLLGRCAAGLAFRSTGPHVIIRGTGAHGF